MKGFADLESECPESPLLHGQKAGDKQGIVPQRCRAKLSPAAGRRERVTLPLQTPAGPIPEPRNGDCRQLGRGDR